MKNFHGYSDYFSHEYIYLFKYLFIKFKILSINMQKYEGTSSQDLICRFNPEKQKGPQLLSVLVASLLYYLLLVVILFLLQEQRRQSSRGLY